MSRSVPRLQFWGGDHRSSAFNGLAKLLMHDKYERIEAIRRSRRERAKRAKDEGASAEVNHSSNDATNNEAVDGPGPEDNNRSDEVPDPPKDDAPPGPEVVPEGEGGAADPKEADHQDKNVSSDREREETRQAQKGGAEAQESEGHEAHQAGGCDPATASSRSVLSWLKTVSGFVNTPATFTLPSSVAGRSPMPSIRSHISTWRADLPGSSRIPSRVSSRASSRAPSRAGSRAPARTQSQQRPCAPPPGTPRREPSQSIPTPPPPPPPPAPPAAANNQVSAPAPSPSHAPSTHRPSTSLQAVTHQRYQWPPAPTAPPPQYSNNNCSPAAQTTAAHYYTYNQQHSLYQPSQVPYSGPGTQHHTVYNGSVRVTTHPTTYSPGGEGGQHYIDRRQTHAHTHARYAGYTFIPVVQQANPYIPAFYVQA